MKICQYCGASMDDKANYCTGCGKLAFGATKAQENNGTYYQTNGSQNYQNPINGYSYGYNGAYQPENQKGDFTPLSIAALVLSLTVSALGGLVCGILDLIIHKNNKHGLSIAAIVISALKIGLIILSFVIVLWGMSSYPSFFEKIPKMI